MVGSLGDDMLDWLTGNHVGNRRGGEALHWLSMNRNKYGPFASNRFDSKNEAMYAIGKIYDAGASLIEVAGLRDDEQRIREEGGPYADTLIVHVENPVKEAHVISTIRSYNPNEFNRVGPGIYRVWWD